MFKCSYEKTVTIQNREKLIGEWDFELLRKI